MDFQTKTILLKTSFLEIILMRFTFHGAAQEVGRSCIEVSDDTSDKRVLFDAGIKVHEHGIHHPTQIENSKDIDAIFLSHAHLDHTGALPLFDHQGMQCPIFCTHITRGISKILLQDSLHIQLLQHQHPAYSKFDINDVLGRMKLFNYGQEGNYKNLDFKFYDAGHIPGSSSILLNIGGKRVLYTGDFNTRDTYLLKGSNIDEIGKVDVLITEATYGNEDHPSRDTEEKSFVSMIRQILDSKGSVLVPVFSLGRAQEIAILLSNYDFGVPIYMDGMARKITSLLKGNKKMEGFDNLDRAMKKVKMIKNPDQRDAVAYSRGIFLSTSGMLNGGPVISYLKHMWHNPNNGILMTGYQAQGTNGKMLMESERAYVDGMQIHFDGPIKKYDFSAHSGKKDLLRIIKKLKPEHLIINHGDKDAVMELAHESENLVGKVHVPELDEEIEV